MNQLLCMHKSREFRLLIKPILLRHVPMEKFCSEKFNLWYKAIWINWINCKQKTLFLPVLEMLIFYGHNDNLISKIFAM